MKKLFIIIAAAATLPAQSQHLPGFSTTLTFQKSAGSFNKELLNQWHNEFLDHVFYGVQEMQLCLQSGSFFKGVNALGNQFLYDKGIILSGEILLNNELENYIRELSGFAFCNAKISDEALDIICGLDKLMKEYSNNYVDVSELEAKLEKMIDKAESINNDIEKIAVQSALVIAAGSARYWEAMLVKYRQRLSHICNMEMAGRSSISGFANQHSRPFIYAGYFELNSNRSVLNPPGRGIIGRMVVSDAVGAFQGAIFGGLGGGPIGAFAGAILGAGARSVMRGLFYGFTGL